MSKYYKILKESLGITKNSDQFDVEYAHGMIGFAILAGLISLEEAESLRKIIRER